MSVLTRILPMVAVIAALGLPSSAAASSCPGANDSTPRGAAGTAATLCLLNAERTDRGLDPLTADLRLTKAAKAFAKDMVNRRFFDHVSPGGGTMLDRLRTAGWVPSSGSWTAGENIAWGSGTMATPATIVAGWMDSPGHRANILQADYTHIGLGIASGAPVDGIGGTASTYVTDFGSRAGRPVPAARQVRSSSVATPR